MAKMVDKVAKSIKQDDGSPCISSLKFALCRDEDGCICRSLARSSIEAMREPTPEMFTVVNLNGFAGDEDNFRSDWSLAIGAALK
jgi:hypothetical protein